MACRDAYESKTKNMNDETVMKQSVQLEADTTSVTGRLLFGVDSETPSNDVLQNNLTEFEWVTRNKLYPNFWGRNITGQNCLTKAEVAFLHGKGCKIAAIGKVSDEMETEEQGRIQAKKIAIIARNLGISGLVTIFLEIGENQKVAIDYMRGYAQELLAEGYLPGFKVNTDAKYDFDREYSRGVQIDAEIFKQCLIWAVSPSLKEYERITTTHLIHPDNWTPYAPSGITRNDIAIWQYGRECHPIFDDAGNKTSFNANLVRDETMILDKMF